MQIESRRNFLINTAYWAVVALAVYLICEYLVPISVPFILGILIAYLVVRVSRVLRCTNKLLRILLILVIYGLVGVLVAFVAVKGVSVISTIVKWLPEFYELKLLPLATMAYEWGV